MIDHEDRPISNNSLHGVAGEVGSSAKTVAVVSPSETTNARRGWLDGVLQRSSINKIPPMRLSPPNSTESERNSINGKPRYEDDINRRTLVSLQEKMDQQQEELDKVRQEAEFQKRFNSELKDQLNQCNSTGIDWSAQGKIEELTREISSEQSEKFRLLRRITELDIHVGELDEMLKQERLLTDYKDGVDKRLVLITRELVDTKVELQQAQRSVIRLQKEQAAIGSVYDKKFSEVQVNIDQECCELNMQREMLQNERKELQEQIQKMKQKESNTGEWQRQLYQKDDTITQLKTQMAGLKYSLSSAQQNLEVSKAEAQTQERYRTEEVQDLRVLNDAQEREISKLKQELEKTQRDLIASDQRCNELQQTIDEQRQPVENDQNEAVVRESDRALYKLSTCRERIGQTIQQMEDRENEGRENELLKQSEVESRLAESTKVVDRLETELAGTRNLIDHLNEMIKDNNENHESKVNGLMFTLDGLAEERDSFEKQLEEVRGQVKELTDERDGLRNRLSTTLDRRPDEASSSQMQVQQALEDLEKKYNKLERDLLEAKLNLAAAEEQKAQLQEDFDHKISKLDNEEKKTGSPYAERAQRLRVQRIYDPYGETTTSDSPSRVNSLVSEVERLQAQLKELQGKEKGTSVVHQQSRGSLEEDMRKELEKAIKTENELKKQLLLVSQEKDNDKNEFQDRLDDRDTTISSLVKSVVTLEDQLESCKMETETLRIRLSREIGVEQVILLSAGSMSPEELEKLRKVIMSSKESGDNLTSEMSRLKKELKDAQDASNTTAHTESMHISTDNEDDDSPLDISNSSFPAHLQLKERDDAIAKLVKQTFAQDKVIRGLRKECAKAAQETERLTKGQQTGPEWEEIIQLRQEAEVFAGQVIEQDEEIEELRTTLAAQEHQITALEQELTEAKSANVNTSIIRDLEAEVDELREANKEQLEELRRLRQTARDVTCSADALKKAQNDASQARVEANEYKQKVDDLSRQKISLLNDLEEKTERIREVDTKLSKELKELKETSNDTIKKLKDEVDKSHKDMEALKISICKTDEFELEWMKTEIQTLQSNLEKQAKELEAAHDSVRELEGMLAQKNAEDAAAHEEEKEELMSEIESLTQQLEEAKKNLATLEQESHMIEGFKQQLERAEEARSESERAIVENYERKLSLLTLDKDVTIDNLRKQIFEEKEANDCEAEEMREQVQNYQLEVSDLREKLSSQIAERDTRIYALERTLEAQEQLVNNMKTEMDHLQVSMETTAARRRQEIDEMQQELLSLTSNNTKLEREIKSLQSELNSKEMSHTSEVAKLNESINKFESHNHVEHRTAADLQMELRVKEVKDRLEKLKWRNTSLKAENENLRERLEIAEVQAKENKRQAAQTEELRELVSKQTDQISELERELDRLKAPASQSSDPEAATLPESLSSVSKNEAKEENQAPSGLPPKSQQKNPEKKPSGPSPLRLSFLRKKANSGDVSE